MQFPDAIDSHADEKDDDFVLDLSGHSLGDNLCHSGGSWDAYRST